MNAPNPRLPDGEAGIPIDPDRLFRLLHQAPVGLAEIAPDGEVRLMNAAAAQVLMPMAPGRPLDNLFAFLGAEGDRLHALCDDRTRPGMLVHGHRIAFRAGRRRVVLGFTVTRTDPDSLLIGIDDLSELVEAEERAQMAEAQAVAASSAKSAFLATMSHELRQPLTAILGFSDVMHAGVFGPLSDRYREYVDHVREAGRHLMDLINDVLDLSKIEAGRLELDVAAVAMDDLFASCRRLMGERAGVEGVALEVVEPPEGLTVRGDARRLKQVLVNLISNAIKFTPRGGRVRVTATAPRDGRTVVAVRDDGCGIAAEEIPVVLEPFGQAGAGRARSDSTGLGLPLSKRIVEAHGGTLDLESAPGAGTTVRLVLPVA